MWLIFKPQIKRKKQINFSHNFMNYYFLVWKFCPLEIQLKPTFRTYSATKNPNLSNSQCWINKTKANHLQSLHLCEVEIIWCFRVWKPRQIKILISAVFQTRCIKNLSPFLGRYKISPLRVGHGDLTTKTGQDVYDRAWIRWPI